MPEMDYNNYNPRLVSDEDDLAVGQSTMDRVECSSIAVSTSSNLLRLTFFTSKKLETITKVRTITGGQAAAATPTLVRIGLYFEESNGDLTLVASTPNDTALYAATQASYTKDFSSPYLIQKGLRYAVGIIVVSGVATPNLMGQNSLLSSEQFLNPKTTAHVSGQTDLASNIPVANLLTSASRIYAAVTP